MPGGPRLPTLPQLLLLVVAPPLVLAPLAVPVSVADPRPVDALLPSLAEGVVAVLLALVVAPGAVGHPVADAVLLDGDVGGAVVVVVVVVVAVFAVEHAVVADVAAFIL